MKKGNIIFGGLIVIFLLVFAYMLIGANPDTDKPDGSGSPETGGNLPDQTGGQSPVTENPPVSGAAFGQKTVLALGTELSFPDGLTVFLREISDSRCPAGAQCIWQGEIAGRLALSGGKLATSTEIQLGTINSKSVVSGGYAFSLLDATTGSLTIRVSPAASSGGSLPGACYVGGCSGQICSDQSGVVSTCEFREEYACYKTAKCERQPSGQCGWTVTAALQQCLANAR